MAGFRHHQSLDHSYRFIYPSWWHKQLIENGDYFHGLVVSQSNFSDNNIDFSKGGFIEINSKDIQTAEKNVNEYIEKLKIVQANYPRKGDLSVEIPGLSQFQYAGTKTINGFEQIYSNRALSDDPSSQLYWKISNGKLYEIFVKYPQDNSKRKSFEIGLNIIINLFWI